MTTLAAFLGELSDTQKALTALMGTLAIGTTLGFTLFAFTGLPDRVAAAESAITELREHDEDADRRFDQLVCLLTLDGRSVMTAQDMIRECGV